MNISHDTKKHDHEAAPNLPVMATDVNTLLKVKESTATFILVISVMLRRITSLAILQY
jgi:hypothetical protein